MKQETKGPTANIFAPIVNKTVRRVHLIGIGGMALSGIARILMEMGYEVSGSDMLHSSYTNQLAKSGAQIFLGHDQENIENADLVIYSAAIGPENPELRGALMAQTPTLRRAEMVGRLIEEKCSIAVAGTHGKTTTSAMIALILDRSGLAPGYLIGARSNELGRKAHWGDGRHLVVEADEYDSAFLDYSPSIAVVTHIEPDHLDYFGSIESMVDQYCTFVSQIQEGGTLFLRDEGALVKEAATAAKVPVVWFGSTGDWTVENYSPMGWGSQFIVRDPTGCKFAGQLPVPGIHNVYNALAAIATTSSLGVRIETSFQILHGFSGIDRRFQLLTESRGISVVEEYSHHPTEIRASIEAARGIKPRRLWVIFQPHLRSRTRNFFQDFANSFEEADRVTITEIFSPSGRDGDDDISGRDLAKAIGGPNTTFQPNLDSCFEEIRDSACDGDLILVMGAGNIDELSKSIANWLDE